MNFEVTIYSPTSQTSPCRRSVNILEKVTNTVLLISHSCILRLSYYVINSSILLVPTLLRSLFIRTAFIFKSLHLWILRLYTYKRDGTSISSRRLLDFLYWLFFSFSHKKTLVVFAILLLYVTLLLTSHSSLFSLLEIIPKHLNSIPSFKPLSNWDCLPFKRKIFAFLSSSSSGTHYWSNIPIGLIIFLIQLSEQHHLHAATMVTSTFFSPDSTLTTIVSLRHS